MGPSRDDAGPLDRTVVPAGFPAGPLATAHQTVVAVGLIALLGCLIILAVSVRQGVPDWLLGLTVAAVVATGLAWYRGYRRHRYGGWDSAVDAATTFLVALAGHSLPLVAGDGVLITRVLLGSMTGLLLANLAQAAAGFACLAAGLLLAGTPPEPTARGLLLTGLGVLVITLVFHRFWTIFFTTRTRPCI